MGASNVGVRILGGWKNGREISWWLYYTQVLNGWNIIPGRVPGMVGVMDFFLKSSGWNSFLQTKSQTYKAWSWTASLPLKKLPGPGPKRKWSSSNHQIIRCESLVSGCFRYSSQTGPKPELRAFLFCVGHLPCWLLKEEPSDPCDDNHTYHLEREKTITASSREFPYSTTISGDVGWCRNKFMIPVCCFPTFSPLKLPRDLKLTCLAATSTLWTTEMFSQNLEKHIAF